jgi:crotonobetainyl-CoA:carnitine CoA-transferase CaiB-like acyl-CoA transferase
MPGPLAGIRVVDVSQILSGPFACMILADQGAEVVKVESPGLGDPMRIGPYRRAGRASFYVNANRGKRGVVLDLAKAAGREALLRLVDRADVFVQNWRPGAAERLGLSYEALSARNPGLIYVSISGYGDSGPYRDRRVYDPIIQGLTGHVGVQKNPDVPIPDLVRNVVADKASAWTAAQAITAALFARARGAGGQHVSIPMLDASLYFFWPDGMMKHTWIGESEFQGPVLYDLYRLWETADGHLIYFTATDSEFHGLFRALGHPEWVTDPRFATIPARAQAESREARGARRLAEIRKWPTKELIERMAAEQVPVGPVYTLDEMLEDPQLRHNRSFVETDHPVAGRMREARPPARFAKTPQQPGGLAPSHGEHTEAVLRELGYDDAALAGLRAEGVIP